MSISSVESVLLEAVAVEVEAVFVLVVFFYLEVVLVVGRFFFSKEEVPVPVKGSGSARR